MPFVMTLNAFEQSSFLLAGLFVVRRTVLRASKPDCGDELTKGGSRCKQAYRVRTNHCRAVSAPLTRGRRIQSRGPGPIPRLIALCMTICRVVPAGAGALKQKSSTKE